MKKVTFKITKKAFKKGFAAGLGWSAEVYTEGEETPFAFVYAGDMSAPSRVCFEDIVIEKALGRFENLPTKEAWLKEKEHLLSLERFEKEFYLYDVENKVFYKENDPEVYGDELLYEVVEETEALVGRKDTYTLFKYKKVKKVRSKIDLIVSLLEEAGIEVYLSRETGTLAWRTEGGSVAFKTYDASHIQYWEITSLGKRILEEGITPEVRKEIAAT